MSDTLSAAAITAALQHPLTVAVYEEIDSTNTEAKRRVTAGDCTDALLLADRQTAGRGRRGRSFWSPAGSGLYMSLILSGVNRLSDAVQLTTLAAAAVVEAVEALTPLHPAIKWVNDIFLNGRKAAGILTESVTDPTTGKLTAVVIGIGINVRPEAYPPELAEIATHLPVSPVTRNELAAAITDRIYRYLDALPEKAYLRTYRAHSLVLGKEVVLMNKEEKTTATAVDIDENGGLVVRFADGRTECLHSGEISVRLSAQTDSGRR